MWTPTSPEIAEKLMPAQPGAVGETSSAGEVVRCALIIRTRQLVAADQALSQGQSEAVHDMRVACRRLRSNLRTFRSLFHPQWTGHLRTELSWLAGLLGPVRDLEVLQRRIVATARRTESMDRGAYEYITATFAARRATAEAAMIAGMQPERYLKLLTDVCTGIVDPSFTSKANLNAVDALPEMVSRTYQKLAYSAGALSLTSPAGRWHKVRIRLKRVRYATEVITPLMESNANRAVKQAADLQGILGDHQDASVARKALLRVSKEVDGRNDIADLCKRMAEQESESASRLRSQFLTAWEDAHLLSDPAWILV